MEATKMSRYTSDHDTSRSVHSFPKTKQHRSIYQHGVDNMLIAKSMLAYSNKMRQIAQNRNFVPFLGGRAYKDKVNATKEPQKKLQPKKAKHTVAKQMDVFLQDDTDALETFEGFNRGRPSSARGHGVFSPQNNIFAFPRRPASDPLMVLDKSTHPFNGYRRYGADGHSENTNRRNADTNVLTFPGNFDRRISVASISSEYRQDGWTDSSHRRNSVLPALDRDVRCDSASLIDGSNRKQNGELHSWAEHKEADISAKFDEYDIPHNDNAQQQQIVKTMVSNKRCDGTTSANFEELADYLRRSRTPIDDSALKKRKLISYNGACNTTEPITVQMKLDGPKLYKEPPLPIKPNSPENHKSSPPTHQSRSSTIQSSSKSTNPSPSKIQQVSGKSHLDVQPSFENHATPLSNKHKIPRSKLKGTNDKLLTKINDENTSNKKPSAVQPKTAEKKTNDRQSKVPDKLPVSVKPKVVETKPKLVIDKLVSKHQCTKDRKLVVEVGLTSDIPTPISSKSDVWSTPVSGSVTHSPSPAEVTGCSSSVAEEGAVSPGSCASSPEVLSPSEREVQQQHLRLFGKTIQGSEVKKRMKKPKGTSVIDLIPEDSEVVNKHTNTRVGIIGEEQTDTDLTETPLKKKKRVQFGEDMIREVTKIQYPWYFEDSSEEDDDDEDDDGDEEDDDESDEDDKATEVYENL